MRTKSKRRQLAWLTALVVSASPSFGRAAVYASSGLEQEPANAASLTPLQLEIEKQEMRLNSADVEQQRDALTRLASLHNKDASRAALAGLTDAAAIVKVTAAEAILSLPADEAARSLIPLLSDIDEFVRREAAYALGKTGSALGSGGTYRATPQRQDR